jgi:prepilin-type N-terminal cleavage/methylation domain-containing protein
MEKANMRKNGFTLVEILIAMFVGALIMAAVYSLMTLTQKTSTSLDRKVITQQDTRTVLDLMAMEIRMASYNPLYTNLTWNNTPGSKAVCMPSVAAANKGIKIATANSIAVAMDLDGSQTIGDDDNEYIVYSYDGASTLTRSVSCAASAIIGGSAPYSNVCNADAGVPLFQYFDKDDNPTASIPDIRRILITIASETSEIDLNTKQTKKLVYSTSVIVRNHAISP